MDEKKRYDFDYTTQFKKEYYYLREHNVKPFISVKDDETGVITFRYRRSSKLFKAVADFYEQYENEKMFNAISKIAEAMQNVEQLKKAGETSESNPLEGILSIDPKLLNMLFRQKKEETANGDHRE